MILESESTSIMTWKGATVSVQLPDWDGLQLANQSVVPLPILKILVLSLGATFHVMGIWESYGILREIRCHRQYMRRSGHHAGCWAHGRGNLDSRW